MKKLILFLLCLISLSANADNKHYAFRGTLGENINFRLDLEEDTYHGIVMGQTTYYRNNGKIAKIKVYGNSKKSEEANTNLRFFILSEFNGTKVCGNFMIALEADGSFNEGYWSLGNKMYGMSNVEFLPTDDAPTFFKPVDIKDAGGVYEFTYASGNADMPEYGGTLQLYPYREDIAYHVSQVTPNIAETMGKMSEIFENRFYFFVGRTSYDVFAFEDVVFVKRCNPQSGHPDSFGANADIEGYYIATGKEPEGEVTNLFDEEIAFCEKYQFSVFVLNALWMDVMGGETTFPDEIIMKDIDGDGKDEVIARYTEGKTEDYEVADNRYAIFTVDDDGMLELVAAAQGKLQELEIADGYVIKNTMNSRGSRTIRKYFQLIDSAVGLNATMSDAEIDSYTIDEKTVKEKDFKKQVKLKNVIKVTDLDDWMEVPGNIHRNETAARG